MNLRWTLILWALTALLSGGCTHSPEREGTDNPYSSISLALSLKSPGDVPQSPATKMSAPVTQNGTPFRGIEQVYVIPFQTGSSAPVTEGSLRLGDRNVVIHHSAIGKTGLVANNNAHLYSIAILPKSMNRVLAYGKSADDGTISTRQDKHRNGMLTPSGLDNPSTPGDISFCLEPVLETADLNTVNQKADNLIAALNGVVEALQASGDADILAFLDVFATENEISACSYQTLYRFEQNILGKLSMYQGANPVAINAVMSRLSVLQTARNAAGAGFPASYGVPEGAMGMYWNGYRFVKIIDGVNVSLVPASQYCYPPGLWYYANSSIMTSTDDEIEEQYKPQNTTWGNILSYYTEGNAITPATRSAAIVDQMQYGTGLVEFRLLTPEGTAKAAAECPLTGIIIGEQRDVDFSFSPKRSAQSRFIYDNNISGISLGGSAQHVPVLVLPTPDDASVHFALEFQNTTSSAFRCQQGTVPPGCKFYLVGELKSEDGTKPAGAPASVFSSDYKTTVKVKARNLGNAYNTVPDLRDPQLELGVVAEMDWFQVEPGGIKIPF